VGVAVFGAGWAMYDCGWFALLSGFVPPEARGRFFGGLRFSWQLTSIAVTFLGAWALGESAATWVFQAFIGFVIAMQFLRLWVYTKKIPDRVHRVHPGPGLLANVMEVLRLPHFAPFCSYCFLLVLFTTVPPTLFTVIEKTFMKLGDDTVVMLSTTTMIGQLVGYMACGLIVDRLGTKPVFTLAHLGFAAALLLFPLRALTGDSILCLAALHMLYGVTFAASSVAMTAELFSLIPNKRKSLSAAIQLTLQGVGVGLSTMIPAACISLGFLKDRWTLLGSDVSAYDAILIGLGMLTLLMIVSLTLVPSVIGKSEEQVP
jgi:MFS family permease